jgi:hypothetical protein
MPTVTYYDSIDSAMDMLATRKELKWLDRWAGAETRDELNSTMLFGDPVRGEKIRNMINDYQVNIRTVGPRQMLDVAGAMPSVPHMLGGDPMHMRRRKPETMNRGKIRLFVNVVVSAGISDSELQARGAAVAALAYNLSTVRPVELWAIGTMNEDKDYSTDESNYHIPCIRIAANPLDPNRVAALLAHPAGARALMFNLRGDCRSFPNWAWEDYSIQMKADKFKERLTPILGLTEDDIVFPGGMLGDVASEPGKWLEAKMRALGLIEA